MYFNNTFYSTLFLVFYIFIIIYYYHLNWWIYFNLWMYYFLVYNYIILHDTNPAFVVLAPWDCIFGPYRLNLSQLRLRQMQDCRSALPHLSRRWRVTRRMLGRHRPRWIGSWKSSERWRMRRMTRIARSASWRGTQTCTFTLNEDIIKTT